MKRLTVALLASLLALTLGSAAHALPVPAAERPGFDFGLRLGYAVPFGDLDGGNNHGLASVFSGAVPLVFEAGYRLNPAFMVGALFQYAFAQEKNDGNTGCGGGVSCSSSVVRLGVQGIYHLPITAVLAPWVGAGIGYEWMDITRSGGTSIGASGFEFLTLEGGADYHLAHDFSVGPFLSLSFARYGTATLVQGGVTRSSDIVNPALHEWLQIGVRGTFGL